MAVAFISLNFLKDGGVNMSFSPFTNESEVLAIGGISIENRLDRVSIFGDLDITRDKAGLEAVQQLRQLLESVELDLRAQTLPEQIEVEPVIAKSNPFR